jgi:hypothetical protein
MKVIAQKGVGDQLDVFALTLPGETPSDDPATLPVGSQGELPALGTVAQQKVTIRFFQASMMWHVGSAVASRCMAEPVRAPPYYVIDARRRIVTC